MKKTALLIAALATAAAASAQIEVTPTGRILVGELGNSTSLGQKSAGVAGADTGLIVGLEKVQPDTLASVNVLGPKANNSGGYITFGDKRQVSIGEYGEYDSDILYMIGEYGLKYKNNNGIVFEIGKDAGASFNFNCDVRANGVLLSSDSRLKTDVEEIADVTSDLRSITPVSYRLSDAGRAAKASAEAAGEIKGSVPDSRLRYGFVAQEVKEVLPALVHEDADGYLSVDYIGFIPLLVDAVRNLSAKVEEQEETIAELSAPAVQRTRRNSGVEGPAEVKASLSQNRPNPFSVSTVTECTLPETVASAELRVYDLQGKQLMKFGIEGRGKTSVGIDGSSLQPGMYIYALIADGEEIDSKRMILTD